MKPYNRFKTQQYKNDIHYRLWIVEIAIDFTAKTKYGFMEVSVVCCTYDEAIYDDFRDAVNSILTQTYSDVELVIVVDGTKSIYERARQEYGDKKNVILHCNDENRGLAASRNVGWKLASGDIIAFMDDDAVADEQWIETLVDVYENQDVVSVGGQMTPNWVAGRPWYLPEEFYWLVGVTHKGFADGPQEVRNTNGSNMSFRRNVLMELGGFDESLGRQGARQIQAEETELCIRMYHEMGYRTWYEPGAKVAHKIFAYRTRPSFLLKRAFWQGYSKKKMENILSTPDNVENDFLWRLFCDFIPDRLVSLIHSRSIEQAAQIGMIFVLTLTVGAGYLYGIVR